MIAIPMKGNKNDSSITTVFGRSKYIALVDETSGEWSIRSVNFESGRDLSSWLASEGVKKLVVKDMGANPFMICQRYGIEVYFCDAKRATVPEIVEALKKGLYQKVTLENFNDIFEGKGRGYGHGSGHHHNHDHDHDHDHSNRHHHNQGYEREGERCCDEPSHPRYGQRW